MALPRPTRRRLIGGGIALAASRAPQAAAQAPASRRLVVAMSGFPQSLEPVLSNQTATRRVVPQIFDTLIAFDHARGMALRPALATGWERLDARRLRLDLRQGVVFHDGSPFTAEDVAFSLGPDHLLGPGREGRVVSMQTLERLERVEIVGPHSVILHAKGDDALLEQRLAAWAAEIVSRRAFEAAGSWNRWAAAPVGTGPYRLVEQRLDRHVALAAHGAYWGGTPPFDAIEYRIVPEVASRVNALLTGEADLATDLAPDQFAEIARRPGLEVAGGPVQNIRYLMLDTNDPVLRDARIRRALSLALDRRLLIGALWQDRLPVPNGFQLPSYGAAHVADFPALDHDPEQARALLRAAGYAGQPITYKLLPNYYPNQVAGAQAMVEMWRAAGIVVRIEMLESFAQIYRRPIHAIFDSSSTAIMPDPLGHAWREFGPAGTAPQMTGTWSNAEYFALGARLQDAIDPEERRRIHRRMLEIIGVEDPPCVVLHASGQFYGKRRSLRWAPGQTLDMDLGPFNPALA
jgi:peptide/nickel transport system substrate-binding protein